MQHETLRNILLACASEEERDREQDILGDGGASQVEAFATFLYQSGVRDRQVAFGIDCLRALDPAIFPVARRLMLLLGKGWRGRSAQELQGFQSLLSTRRARQETHRVHLQQVLRCLRKIPGFERPAEHVITFLRAPNPSNTLDDIDFSCVAGGCRGRWVGIIAFLNHIQDKHM